MEAGLHGAVEQQRQCRAEAQRRGCAGSGDVQGRVGPREPVEMCRAMQFLTDGEMREAVGSPSSPPCQDPPRRVSSPASLLFSLSSLLPSLN